MRQQGNEHRTTNTEERCAVGQSVATRVADGEEESASLVCRETLPDGSWSAPLQNGLAGPRPFGGDADEEEEDKLLITARYHEDLLNQAGGHGAFQKLALLVCGVSLASDSVELFAVPYVMPSAEQELCLDECHKTWLNISSLVGMLIGGFAWGALADRLGRRRALLSAMSTNAVFGIVSAFMPTFDLFLLMRLCSGIGIGGSLPIVFTFFAEFLVRKGRGYHLGMLLLFWAEGGIFVSVLAWAIVPWTGESLMDSKQLEFGRWRVFLLVCSLPAVVSVIGITFMPESPRFLLEMGRNSEALYVYKKIYAANNTGKLGAEYQLAEMVLPSRCPVQRVFIPSNRGLFLSTKTAVCSFFEAYAQILSSHSRLTIFLLATWATLSFGFYGMIVWFPAYADLLKTTDFEGQAGKESDLLFHDRQFNTTLENVHFFSSLFVNVRFTQMLISHSTFHNCSFWNCTFSDVRSSRSFFSECDFEETVFIDTDLYPYKFHSCSLNGTHFYSTKGGCDLDFDIRFDLSDIFFKNLFAQMAVFLGTVASAFLLDKFGRVRIMGASFILSGASVLAFWFVEEKRMITVFECIFSFVCISAWNSLDVLSTEAYPVHIRATSYGFLSSVSRLAAIIGNILFSRSIDCPKAVTVLTGTAIFIAGTLCVHHLPETTNYLL